MPVSMMEGILEGSVGVDVLLIAVFVGAMGDEVLDVELGLIRVPFRVTPSISICQYAYKENGVSPYDLSVKKRNITSSVTGIQLKSPVKSALLTPPRNSSESS